MVNIGVLSKTLNLATWAYVSVNFAICHVAQSSMLSTPPARHPSPELYTDLEESSRIVDISYCVGVTGVHRPFACASRCSDFKGFELIKTWETGPLLSDSCGYIAVDHGCEKANGRIIVAFRGTYSIANTIADLSTIPQKYTPYPGEEEGGQGSVKVKEWGKGNWGKLDDTLNAGNRDVTQKRVKCHNCSVHIGFMTSWRHTRGEIVPNLEILVRLYPHYRLTLVGHSLGGAVAALASLDFHARGWNPQVTTFGEPRVGNKGLCQYIDETFPPNPKTNISDSYHRVTHVDDPVPLLPLHEWGYCMHAGEIFISKPDLSPDVEDLVLCHGQADPNCIDGAQSMAYLAKLAGADEKKQAQSLKGWYEKGKDWFNVPPRYRIWQLFFAHRDYFWRLGLCVPQSKHTEPEGETLTVPEEDISVQLR